MAPLRFHLLLGAILIALAGCAQQPQRSDHNAPGASSTAAGATATPASASPAATAASLKAMQSAVPPSLLVFAREEGYRQVFIKGDRYYFCKTEDPMGSFIPVRQCIDRVQLESLRVRADEQQQQLSRRPPEIMTPPP